MYTTSRRALSLLLTVLVCTLSISACKTSSSAATIKPTPPRVDCQLPDPKGYGRPPKANEWLQYTPELNGPGVATLSRKAAAWINEVQAAYARLRVTREDEHKCIDEHVDKGVISK